MSLLKNIIIAGTTFSVKEVMPDISGLQDDTFWGRIVYDTREILIKKTITNEDKWNTLIHELIHGCIHETGISSLVSKENEELFVSILAQVLFDTLVRNKLLTIPK